MLQMRSAASTISLASRILNKKWVQASELMGQYGINVPPGIAVKKIEDLLPAAKKMADSDGEVRSACMHFPAAL